MAIRLFLIVLPVILASLAAVWWFWPRLTSADLARARALCETAEVAPTGPLSVYHLGHSLVGRDMPAMLMQLAGTGHTYNSQLGWGTTLREHWEPELVINGFDVENAHPRFRPASEAIASGDYDAVVLTEMVGLREAIRYHDSPTYLAKWAEFAAKSRPGVRLYLYETWHNLDDPAGWIERLDADLPELWENKVLLPAVATTGTRIHVIPAGQVMARFVRRVEAAGGIGEVRSREDLFTRNTDGTLDTIHLNDLGAYLVALTHYAVLYHRSPVGLPHALLRADGTPATPVSAEAARAMQEVVWEVVSAYPMTGVAQ